MYIALTVLQGFIYFFLSWRVSNVEYIGRESSFEKSGKFSILHEGRVHWCQLVPGHF